MGLFGVKLVTSSKGSKDRSKPDRFLMNFEGKHEV